MSYVKVYDDVLPSDLCESIIQKFESHPEIHDVTYLENHRSFTEVNINKHKELWKSELDVLFGTMQK